MLGWVFDGQKVLCMFYKRVLQVTLIPLQSATSWLRGYVTLKRLVWCLGVKNVVTKPF